MVTESQSGSLSGGVSCKMIKPVIREQVTGTLAMRLVMVMDFGRLMTRQCRCAVMSPDR